MTDRRASDGHDPGRLDLRCLALRTDGPTHFVIERVLAEILLRARAGTDLSRTLVRWQRGMAAAAVVLAAVAVSVLGIERLQQPPFPAAELIAVWAKSNHVPTNGELLTAYLGYQP